MYTCYILSSFTDEDVLLTPSVPRVSLWKENRLALDRVKSAGVRQSKICKNVLGTERVKGDSFLTPSVPRVSLWRVKLSGVRQSKICKYVLSTERVNTRIFSRNGERIPRRRNQSKSLPSLKATQRTAISNDKTCQIVNVTSDADKLFLSRETCAALRMISENFPTVGETLHLSKAMVPDEDPDGSQPTTPAAIPPTPESALNSPCNYPHHQTSPPKPTQLCVPFPATEANQQHLQT